MNFETYLRTQLDLRSEIKVRIGIASDNSSASIMTWSDKSEGTHFWDVSGDQVVHVALVGNGD